MNKNILNLYDFYTLLQEEIFTSNSDELRKYYRNIVRKPEKKWFYFNNWINRLIIIEKYLKDDVKILDAGCGLGTESILFSIMGGSVIGIDVNQDFVEKAKKRKSYYEKKLNKVLNINFQAASIFDIRKENYFDIIWAMESISHIYPPKTFLKQSYSMLKKGGIFFISDTNSLNPLTQAQVIKNTKKIIRKPVEKKHPQTGKIIKDGNENLLNPFKLRKMLGKIGFEDIKSTSSLFFPPFFFKNKKSIEKIQKIEEKINNHCFLRYFGGIYNVVARK